MTLETLLLLVILAEASYLAYNTIAKPTQPRDNILLDTSVLIDGRIEAIARSGLITSKLLIPKSVVRELQFMADKADHDKRERARFGLEMIEKLQALDTVKAEVVEDGKTDKYGVDEQLIVLAKQWNARLCTIDYNLNKSARVQNIIIVNINELAHALRVTYLPGETLEIKLVQTGQESGQAIGYLDDGTMVVVDDSRKYIGSVVNVKATRVLQTAAGKMMFASRQGQGTSQKPAEKSIKPRQQTQQVTREPKPRQSQQRTQTQPSQPKKPQSPRPQQKSVEASAEPLARRAYHARPARRRDVEDNLMTLVDKQK